MNPDTKTKVLSLAPRWLLAVAALALLVRLSYLLQFSQTPFARYLFLDSEYCDQWADEIAAGNWLGDRPFFFEPGYSYLLAVVKLFGGKTTAVRLIQALLGTGTVVLTALLGRRLGGERAGIAAGVLSALYVTCIYYEGLVLKTTTEVFLGMALLVLLMSAVERPRLMFWGGLGVLAGLASWVKGNFLVLLPAFLLWSWFALRRRGHSRPYLPPAAMLAGCMMVIGCSALRNYVVSHEWIPLVYESGFNFYIGNGPEANGARLDPPFVRAASKYEEIDSNAEAVRRAGRKLSYQEISAFWWNETWKGIERDPAHWIKLLGTKLLIFWHRYENSDNVSMYFVRRWVPLLRWPLPGWWLVAPLGLAGLVVAFLKRDEMWILVAAYALLLMLALVLFKVVDRYRLAAAPPLIALGCAAAVEGWKAKRTTGAAAAGAALVGFILADVLPHPVFAHGETLANHYEMLGVVYANEGQADAAIDQFRQAVVAEPNLRTAHYNLGRALHRLKQDEAGAEDSLRRALRLDPNDGESLSVLGDVLVARDRVQEAADVYSRAAAIGFKPGDCLIAAAGALGRIGRYDEAQRILDEAFRLKPDDPKGWEILGNLRYVQNDLQGTLEAWERSLELKPDNPGLRKNFDKLRADSDDGR